MNHTRHAEEVIRHTWDWWQEIRWLGSGRIHTHYPCSGDRQRKRYRMSSMFVKDEWRCMREMSLLTSAKTLFSMRYRNWTETTEKVEASYPPNAAGCGELPSPVQHVQQHDLVEHRTVQDCQQEVVRSDYILTINGAMLQQNMGSRVSALSTMVYSTMYSYDSTDRSNSLLTSTRDASQC